MSRSKISSKAKSQKPRVAREKAAAYRAESRVGLPDLERAALENFRARLKRIIPKNRLKSLILYGSQARGDAHPGADIDVLIVYDASRGNKKNAIRNAAYQVELAAFERDEHAFVDIEPLVLTEAEYKNDAALGMPLLHNVAREGIVLEGEPVMPEKMNRKFWAAQHLDEAKRTLRSARLVLADGDVRRAISLAFFIYESAARAALIAKNIVPQSHAGTQSLFGQHFIKTGIVSKKFSPHFKRLEDDRLDATYTLEKKFTTEDAERALATAEEMLVEVEKLLPALLAEEN